MSKLPYKPKKSEDCEDDDEIVSFESFCNDNAANDVGKNDALTLNDNINYHLFYEHPNDPSGSITSTSLNNDDFKETSLSGLNPKFTHRTSIPKPNKFYQRSGKCAFLGKFKSPSPAGIRVSARGDDENMRYERFSSNNQSFFSKLPSVGSGLLIILVVCILCIAVWWGVWGIVGGSWGEEHYRRLWEKAHPNHNQQIHYSPSVIVHQQLERLDPVQPFEIKYHDHNNLSTKNKLNASENGKKQKVEIIRKNIALLGEFQGSETPPVPDGKLCQSLSDDVKFDCFPEGSASESSCRERGCCWIPHNQQKHPLTHYQTKRRTHGALGVPYCFYPPNYNSYQFVNITETREGITSLLERQFKSPYKNDISWIKLDVNYLSDTTLQIKISDAENYRYEPPHPSIPIVPTTLVNPLYRVEIEALKLGFKVIRNAENTTVMNTQGVGGFTFADKFLQLSTLLPSGHIYGLGEHRARFPLNILWQRYTIFNHDTRPNENTNLYGSHPFYMVMEKSGRSHGVFLLNSNAMDVILQPAPAVTYRTIGGIFNFLVFLGPTPRDVVAQYTDVVGRPFMPPYWSLGFHLCKFDYGSLNATREVWERTRNAGIPFDVQWNDLDYMNNSNDFTYDKRVYGELPSFVKQLHASGMHYVPLIDPGISASEKRGTYPPFDRGLEMNIFIKNQSGLPFVGKVWNKQSTVWPDFTHPNTTSYWVEMLSTLHKEIPFDGAWIDMNEPSNFLSGPKDGSCAPEDLEYTPAVSGGNGLKSSTLCMDAEQFAGSHYNLHNLYSLTEAIATNFALTEIRGRRPFIISRSTFSGIGKYSGHWSGDNYSDWYDMKMTIPELLMFSIFGIPMMGADICGFNGNTTVELCRRWMELGAFYPFSRNHNSDSSMPQDPAFLGPTVVDASKRALTVRYTLLPYLYTLFWKAHIDGDTVATPTFFEFPEDVETYELDQQFMWGPSLLIAPILDPNVNSVRAYVPKCRWYKFNGSMPLNTTGWMSLNDGDTLLVRGGSILPLQEPDQRKNTTINTSVLRSQPFQLLVGLDDQKHALGELYWDDGDSLNTYEEMKYSHIIFTATVDTMESQVVWWGYGVPPVNKIIIMGLTKKVTSVFLNDKPINFNYYPDRKLLVAYKINLLLDRPFVLLYKSK